MMPFMSKRALAVVVAVVGGLWGCNTTVPKIVFKHGEVAKKVIGAYPKRKLEAELEPVLA